MDVTPLQRKHTPASSEVARSTWLHNVPYVRDNMYVIYIVLVPTFNINGSVSNFNRGEASETFTCLPDDIRGSFSLDSLRVWSDINSFSGLTGVRHISAYILLSIPDIWRTWYLSQRCGSASICLSVFYRCALFCGWLGIQRRGIAVLIPTTSTAAMFWCRRVGIEMTMVWIFPSPLQE